MGIKASPNLATATNQSINNQSFKNSRTMKRFNVNAVVNGNKVTFGVENQHIVMFHDVRSWDDDCKAKLGIKSGRARRYATDLGYAPSDSPTNAELSNAVESKFGHKAEFGESQPKVQPRKESKESKEQPQEQPQQQTQPSKPRFSADAVKSQNHGNGNSGADMVGAIFGAMQTEITNNVLHTIEPYINSVQRTELVIKTPDKVKIEEGIFHEKFPEILELINSGANVYMFGPAGSGKSYMAKQVADALDLDFYEQQRVTQDYQILGWPTADGGWVETPFFKAFTRGGLFSWDECDASIPESGLAVNGALEQGRCVFGDKMYEKHPNFRMIASGNTNGQGADEEYVGRFCQDAALFDRFEMVFCDYCPELEKALANNDLDILDFVRQLRKVRDDKHIKLIVGNRLIKRMVTNVGGPKATLVRNIVNRLDKDVARILMRALPEYKGKWFDAAKQIASAL